MANSAKVLITSDFPTPDEVASALGISPTRVAELRQIIHEVRAEKIHSRAIRRSVPKRRTTTTAKKK